MRGHFLRWVGLSAVLLAMSISTWAQAGMRRSLPSGVAEEGPNLGYPQDWSSRHLLMPHGSDSNVPATARRDPRHVYNMVMRRVAIRNSVGKPRRPSRMKVDWSVSLENGYVPRNQFPAKYQFNVSAESCTSDYVVFGLTVTSGTQANLVGINNLYTGATPACNGGSPSVSFGYNTVTQTGGQIKTSPVISPDGTKIAFVESTNGASYFHVLALPNPIPSPPSAAGTVLSPVMPISCTKPTIAGCMTTLAIEATATNSNSSPWVDYNTDTAYVGSDNGILYKINPVFGGGAPALVNDPSNWPVVVSTNTLNNILTAPVVDNPSGRIFLGDGEGYLYAVNLSNPGKTFVARQPVGWVYDGTNDGSGGAGTGVIDPPIVVTDPANSATDQVFAFTGCSVVQGIGGAISQLPASFTSAAAYKPTTANTVDMGSASGIGDCTGNNVYSGTFDNTFWTNGSTTGHIIACGFLSGTRVVPLKPSNAKMYFFPFATNVVTSTGSSSVQMNGALGDECSPLTEFFNGTTDRLFFGLGGSTDGFVESSTITTSLTTPICAFAATSSCVTSPRALGGTSGIVIDNQVSNGGTNIYFSTLTAGSVNGQSCKVAGGSVGPRCAVKLTQSALK